MIYFDNAATSFPKPQCVINGVNVCLKKIGGNPSRSSHRLSRMAGEEVYLAREGVAKLLNAPHPENAVFTYNATYALNLAIKTIITEKCHVIISDIEHNSVIRPINSLTRRLGIEVSEFDSDLSPEEAILPLIRNDTRVIISTLASNVTGKEIDFAALSQVAKKCSLKLIIDASQAIGHRKIDLSKCDCDAICAPAHKALFGIQGTGFVYFKEGRRIGEFIEGGSGTNSIEPTMPMILPEGYEAGTLATPGIVALRHGIEFVNLIGIENIEHHLNKLRNKALMELCEIKGIILYKTYGGNILLNLEGLPSSTLAELLDKQGVCTRAGLHCAPSAHRKLGTLTCGAVRLSFSIMNTSNEVERFTKILRAISSEYVKSN